MRIARSLAGRDSDLRAQLADGAVEQRLVQRGIRVEIAAAPAADEGAPGPLRRDDEADAHRAEVERPGHPMPPAAGADLPGADLRLANPGCVVAGEHVM